MGKLRILCLHGYRQNEQSFREKTGGLRKLIKREAEFVFTSAPHVIPEPENLARLPPDQERGWFFSRPEKAYKATDETDVCLGLEESIEHVEMVMEQSGPYDGLLGFSQGACFISLLCSHKARHPDSPVQFRFVVLFAGFKSLLVPHVEEYAVPFAAPSLHAVGESDGVVPLKMAEDLLPCFVNATPYRHSGGHYIPASPPLRTAIQDFLRPFAE